MNKEIKIVTTQERVDSLVKEQSTNNTLSKADQEKVDKAAKQRNIDEIIRRMTEQNQNTAVNQNSEENSKTC